MTQSAFWRLRRGARPSALTPRVDIGSAVVWFADRVDALTRLPIAAQTPVAVAYKADGSVLDPAPIVAAVADSVAYAIAIPAVAQAGEWSIYVSSADDNTATDQREFQVVDDTPAIVAPIGPTAVVSVNGIAGPNPVLGVSDIEGMQEAVEAALGAVDDIETFYTGRTMITDIDMTIPTTSVAAGAVLADTQIVANVFRAADTGGYVQSVTIIDKDDVGAAVDLVFFDANVSLGTEGAAASLSDANAERVLAVVRIGTSDFVDFGGVRVASVTGMAIPLKPISGTASIAIAARQGAAAATRASGLLRVRLGVIQD
jgi:hypothetical protein